MSNVDFGVRSSPGSKLGGDDRPLTDQESQLLQRLLSDPFSFPLAFKSWLVSYLETSDLSLTMSSVIGLQSTLGISGAGEGTLGIFPAGLILPFGGAAAPVGSVLCDGAAYGTTVKARLFAAIGYTYGGSGASFNVPDLRGRVPVGLGPSSYVATLGANEGQPAPSGRAPVHRTSDAGGAASEGITAGGDAQVRGSAAGTELGVHHHGPDGFPIDTPAYLTINFIIVS